MTQVCQRITEVRLGNYCLTDLEYADDTTLFGNTDVDLIASLNVFQKEASELGLQVSCEKTKLMHIDVGADPPQIAIKSTTTNFMDSFNYLRSLILSTRGFSGEVSQYCGLTAAVMQSLWKPLWRQNNMSYQTKLHVYYASVLSVLLYSSETWPLIQSLTKI